MNTKIISCYLAFLALIPFYIFAQQNSVSRPLVSANFQEAERTVDFRVGTIYSAEITTKKPEFSIESPFDASQIQNPAWVEIIVKIKTGRTISRFDYVLKGISENPYTCLAIAEANEPYSVNIEKWIVTKPNQMRYYRLLFPVEQGEISVLGNSNTAFAKLTLQLNYFTSQIVPLELKIRNKGNSGFSSISRIPTKGLYGISERDIIENR